MNEQIEKIYDEACLGSALMLEAEFCEKFALLIAAECARICYDEDYTSGSGYARAIMRKFGITE
jgi:hypothetical protein